MSFEYWYLFPVSIGVATLAMASGIGGAVFFSPIFLLWLKLEPSVAIGTALITEFSDSNCVEEIVTGSGSWGAPRTTRATPAMTRNGAAET